MTQLFTRALPAHKRNNDYALSVTDLLGKPFLDEGSGDMVLNLPQFHRTMFMQAAVQK